MLLSVHLNIESNCVLINLAQIFMLQIAKTEIINLKSNKFTFGLPRS